MSSFVLKMFVAVMAVAALATLATAQADTISFDLHVDPAIVSCLSADGGPTPTAHVTVKRGKFNDTLTIEGNNFRPHLAFDMFTVQRSKFLANGNPDPNFHGSFGLAWYQSDLEASGLGHFKTTDQNHPARPDLRLRPGRGARTDQHVPRRLLVQQPGRRGQRLRLRRNEAHAVQR